MYLPAAHRVYILLEYIIYYNHRAVVIIQDRDEYILLKIAELRRIEAASMKFSIEFVCVARAFKTLPACIYDGYEDGTSASLKKHCSYVTVSRRVMHGPFSLPLPRPLRSKVSRLVLIGFRPAGGVVPASSVILIRTAQDAISITKGGFAIEYAESAVK